MLNRDDRALTTAGLVQHDWQLWWMTVLVILALTTTLVGVYAPQLTGAPSDLNLQHRLYLFGLSCLVILFCIYVLHTRHTLGRLNGILLAKMENSARELAETNAALEKEVAEHQRAKEELRRLYEELKASQWQLIQAEKMESVGRLASGVAHEVKNPLATILMGVHYLSQHLAGSDDNVTVALKEMDTAIKRADSVVKGLLDFSVARQLEMTLEDVNAIVEQALLLVRHELARGHITLVKALEEALPRLQLDRNKIEQLLINLLINAIHSMPGGGTLTVRTSLKQLTTEDPNEGHRHSGRFRPGETVLIVEVEDTGVGIPEDHLHKIFDPFFTTKPRGVGTGLGLTVARSIIELHGGDIAIRNRPEGGVRATTWFRAKGGG